MTLVDRLNISEKHCVNCENYSELCINDIIDKLKSEFNDHTKYSDNDFLTCAELIRDYSSSLERKIDKFVWFDQLDY